MCYRKSFVEGPSDQLQEGTCPSCGMPVVAAAGVTSGTCPHCGKPIPLEPPSTPEDGTPFTKKTI